MLAVIDTNVFVSGLLGSPSCRRVFRAFLEGRIEILISDLLFQEIKAVLSRPKFSALMDDKERNDIIAFLNSRAVLVKPKRSVTLSRDIEDNKILECAGEGADIIISGDKDLLELGAFEGIPIVSPSGLLRIIKL